MKTKSSLTVSESENFNSKTPSTLAQLLDIDSQLSAQEDQLRTQLESIQQKRNSLKVVIGLFAEADKAKVTNSIKESIPQANTKKQLENIDESMAVSQTIPNELPIALESKKGKKTASPSKPKSQTKKTQSKKTVKQTPGWQQYLLDEFRNSSLPQAISSVIKSQPERVWDINAVAEAIFVDKIPHEVKKKVRLQITNLLAQGARENKWYRGQQGFYTMSKEAAKLSSTET